MPTVTYVGPHTKGVDSNINGATVHFPHNEDVDVDDASGFEGQADFLVDGKGPSKVAGDSVADVLAAVGDDPDKAREALAAENTRPNPRKGVLGPLTALIEGA